MSQNYYARKMKTNKEAFESLTDAEKIKVVDVLYADHGATFPHEACHVAAAYSLSVAFAKVIRSRATVYTWAGHLDIYPELCCDECQRIEHHHFDCPICGKEYAASKQYGEIEPGEGGISIIECDSCDAVFTTLDYYLSPDAYFTGRETR